MLLRRRLMRRGRLLLRSAGRVIRVVRRRPRYHRVMRSRGSRRALLAAARRRMVHATSAAARDVAVARGWPGHGLRRRTRRNVGPGHLIVGRSTRRRWTGYVV